jgi:hypothetical protein
VEGVAVLEVDGDCSVLCVSDGVVFVEGGRVRDALFIMSPTCSSVRSSASAPDCPDACGVLSHLQNRIVKH